MGKELGKRILVALQKSHMTQRQLSEKIGTTEAALSRYISGEREPKPDMIANIATALHTTSDYLLGIENNEFNLYGIKRIIARNSGDLTDQERKELIGAIFGEE